MRYKNYVNLGFERIDMNDSVEFDETGWGGFALEKRINSSMNICVDSRNLSKPHLYIKKYYEKKIYHIISISIECMKDLIMNFKKAKEMEKEELEKVYQEVLKEISKKD
jgi:hypothetical protein